MHKNYGFFFIQSDFTLFIGQLKLRFLSTIVKFQGITLYCSWSYAEDKNISNFFNTKAHNSVKCQVRVTVLAYCTLLWGTCDSSNHLHCSRLMLWTRKFHLFTLRGITLSKEGNADKTARNGSISVHHYPCSWSHAAEKNIFNFFYAKGRNSVKCESSVMDLAHCALP